MEPGGRGELDELTSPLFPLLKEREVQGRTTTFIYNN